MNNPTGSNNFNSFNNNQRGFYRGNQRRGNFRGGFNFRSRGYFPRGIPPNRENQTTDYNE